jgi:hypothetical protein
MNIQKYRALQETGISPQRIYLSMKSDKLDYISCIKALRQILDIPVREARELISHADALEASSENRDEIIFPIGDTLGFQQQHDWASHLIVFLVMVKHQPRLYIGNDARTLRDFLAGILTGYQLCGVITVDDQEIGNVRDRIKAQRGWPISSQHTVDVMHAFGYPYQAIVNETIEIEGTLIKWLYVIQQKK